MAESVNSISIIPISEHSLEIRPITENEVDAVLEVYRQCEDFLALGPVSTASMDMVRKDIEISQQQDGVFCGIYNSNGTMIGIVDYVPRNFEGNPQSAFLSLLMIAAPFRKRGVGTAVVAALEAEIRRDKQMQTILSGVQVNNPQAVQFWQRHGYRITGGPELMPDQTTVFHLRKDLSPEV